MLQQKLPKNKPHDKHSEDKVPNPQSQISVGLLSQRTAQKRGSTGILFCRQPLAAAKGPFTWGREDSRMEC